MLNAQGSILKVSICPKLWNDYISVLRARMEIGQKVKVFRLRDRVSKDIADRLGKVGLVKDFKMTDGSGVGAVVAFDDNKTTWFFEDELKPVD